MTSSLRALVRPSPRLTRLHRRPALRRAPRPPMTCMAAATGGRPEPDPFMVRSQIVIENPILDAPYEAPARHFRFDDDTGRWVDGAAAPQHHRTRSRQRTPTGSSRPKRHGTPPRTPMLLLSVVSMWGSRQQRADRHAVRQRQPARAFIFLAAGPEVGQVDEGRRVPTCAPPASAPWASAVRTPMNRLLAASVDRSTWVCELTAGDAGSPPVEAPASPSGSLVRRRGAGRAVGRVGAAMTGRRTVGPSLRRAAPGRDATARGLVVGQRVPSVATKRRSLRRRARRWTPQRAPDSGGAPRRLPLSAWR